MESGATRYILDNNYRYERMPFPDLELVQIGRRYCEAGEVIAAHAHLDWFELTIVNSGVATVVANGEASVVRSGDIFVSLPCDVHEIRADHGYRLEYDFFSFVPTDSRIAKSFKSKAKALNVYEGRVFSDGRISALIADAISELVEGNGKPDNTALLHIFPLVLIYLERNFDKTRAEGPSVSDMQMLCYRVMSYIDTHIYSLRRLDEISEKLGYSYGYLSSVFKKVTGKTISDHYHTRKLETARALILERKRRIGEIAEMLGYSPFSFSKAFKEKYGVSPKQLQIGTDQ